jgi:hypothetical protein
MARTSPQPLLATARSLASGVSALCAAALLVGCATPASEVKVPTVSMDEALRASVAGSASDLPKPAQAQVVQSLIRPDRPTPIVSAPDIRLAYVYEWVDSEGTWHFPNWIALPVRPFEWVLPDLGKVPMDGSWSQRAPANPLPAKPKSGNPN